MTDSRSGQVSSETFAKLDAGAKRLTDATIEAAFVLDEFEAGVQGESTRELLNAIEEFSALSEGLPRGLTGLRRMAALEAVSLRQACETFKILLNPRTTKSALHVALINITSASLRARQVTRRWRSQAATTKLRRARSEGTKPTKKEYIATMPELLETVLELRKAIEGLPTNDNVFRMREMVPAWNVLLAAILAFQQHTLDRPDVAKAKDLLAYLHSESLLAACDAFEVLANDRKTSTTELKSALLSVESWILRFGHLVS